MVIWYEIWAIKGGYSQRESEELRGWASGCSANDQSLKELKEEAYHRL